MRTFKIISVIITIIFLGFLLPACTGPVESKPLEKITTKETQVLFSESTLLRSNTRSYIYMVEGIAGQHKVTGSHECLKTFNIELGRPYTVNIDYNNGKIVMIKDLCEFTARLKAKSLM